MTTIHDPIQVGPTQLRNRIVLPPHQPGLASGGQVTQKYVEYHRRRAKAGVAMQITGATPVAPSAEWSDICLWNVDDSIVPGYRQLGRAVRAEGGRMLAQLAHPGPTEFEGTEVIGPSRDFSEVSRQVAVEATPEQLERIVGEYQRAARRCAAGELDGVEISMAHGLLLAAFLSPLTNRRDDEFGGTFERRLELPRRVLEACRAVIGPDMILGMRLGADDLVEGGLKPADAGAIASALEGYVDYVSVMVGNNNRLEARTRHWPPTPAEQGLFRPVFREVKKHLPNTPVIGVGRILDLEIAGDIVASGDADLVGMVRAHIADPDILSKASGQVSGAARPCVGANVCVNSLMLKKPLTCMINPDVGHPDETSTSGALSGRLAAVVGAGPAGLEVARRLAEQDCRVVLLERNSRLGGRLADWGQAPVRREFLNWVEWQESELVRLGVEVRTGVDATDVMVRGFEADFSIIATGASAVGLDVPSDGTVELLSPDELFARGRRPGSAVVYETIGELDGPVLVDYLESRGTPASLATARIHAGEGEGINTLIPMLRHLGELDTSILERVELSEMRDGQAIFRDRFGGSRTHHVPAEAVIAWSGATPDDSLAQALRRQQVSVIAVGDLIRPRRVTEAVADAKRIVDQLVEQESSKAAFVAEGVDLTRASAHL